jgi:hypothetical protein
VPVRTDRPRGPPRTPRTKSKFLSVNGPSAGANRARRNFLANRARDADNAIADGNFSFAIDKLESLLLRIDGASPPPDWMDESPAKTALAEETEILIVLLLL